MSERFLMLYDEVICWGDSIQRARMVPYLAPHCPDTVLVVRRELVRLFSQLGLRVVAFDDVDHDGRARLSRCGAYSLPPGVRIPRGDEWEQGQQERELHNDGPSKETIRNLASFAP